ncbi:MAG TPA: hypothetical protein VJT67_16510 [Longimicrobiaceae bacterium]|nr:hypothetical protein [Longimicrobiaceae bacterium]
MLPADYSRNVFINCPFDQRHEPLFRAMVFAVHDCGFVARCALETVDSGEARIRKIIQIMRESRYGIHDISRIELDPGTRLPRFNMPLELGIFIGAREFGSREQRQKEALILDRDQYRYQAFCSDIAGQDILTHSGSAESAILAVRAFLANKRAAQFLPAGGKIAERYELFRTELPSLAQRFHLFPAELTFTELRDFISGFQLENPW